VTRPLLRLRDYPGIAQIDISLMNLVWQCSHWVSCATTGTQAHCVKMSTEIMAGMTGYGRMPVVRSLVWLVEEKMLLFVGAGHYHVPAALAVRMSKQ